MTEQRTERTAEEARQARKGRPVLVVLVASVALVAIGFGIVAMFPDSDQPTIGAIDTVSEQPVQSD